MKTLHLHIGFPKTGTCSIQSALYKNRKLLNQHDFELFNTRPDGKEEIERTPGHPQWIYHKTPFYSEYCFNGATNYTINEIVEKEKLAQFLSNTPYHNVIFSSEHLMRAPITEVEKLFPILKKYFNTIYVYVYIRRQDRYEVSLTQESARFSHPNHNTHFRSLRTVKHLVDCHQKIKEWAHVIGKENMRIRVFEKNRLIENDAVIDFFHTIGLAKLAPQITTEHINESLGFERTKVGHLLNTIDIHQVMKEYLRLQLDNTGKCLPSRKDAEEYYAHFRESNIALNKEFNISQKYEAIFNDDFSDYPIESEDIWTEESANQAIKHILIALSNFCDLLVQQVTKQEKLQHIEEIKSYKEKIKQLTQAIKNINK